MGRDEKGIGPRIGCSSLDWCLILTLSISRSNLKTPTRQRIQVLGTSERLSLVVCNVDELRWTRLVHSSNSCDHRFVVLMVEPRSICPLLNLQTHTRFLVTLRSKLRPSDYHSIVIFRLASSDANDYQLYAMESTCPHLGADMGHADIEDSDMGLVAVCPWHRYDFDLRTGKSDTGLKACTFSVKVEPSSEGSTVWVEAPGAGEWDVVELRPVSEGMRDLYILACHLA